MAKTFIKTSGAISAGTSSVTFIDGTSDVVFDNTYSAYEFHWTGIHPENDNGDFGFQVNAVGGSGFNDLITASMIRAWNIESGTSTHIGGASGGEDQTQGDGLQKMYDRVDYAADSGAAGILTIYDPSTTGFIRHFLSRMNSIHADSYTMECITAGYVNSGDPADQPAIDEIEFKFDNGDIDAGEIRMYGVS